MKGKVLGYDGSAGAITGEDGTRYRFEAANWRDQRLPQPNQEVDFVAEGEAADEIYVTRAAGILGADFSGGTKSVQGGLARAGESDIARRGLALAKSRPNLVLAALILIVSVLFTWAEFRTGRETLDPSLIGASSTLSAMRAETEEALVAMAGIGRGFGVETRFAPEAEALRAHSTMLGFSFLLYLVPLAAALVLWLGFRGKRSRLAEIGLGAAAVLSGLYYFALREVAAGAVDDTIFGSAAATRAAFSFGLGGWLVFLGGIAVLLIAFGIVRLDRSASAAGVPGHDAAEDRSA